MPENNLPDSYIQYVASQPQVIVDAEMNPRKSSNPLDSLYRAFAILLVIIILLVLIFGWSTARNNPFSVLSKYIPTELFPGARSSKEIVSQAIVDNLSVEQKISGKFDIDLLFRNSLNENDKVKIDSSGIYLQYFQKKNSLVKIVGDINLEFGKDIIYDFSNQGFSYSLVKKDGTDYLNIDLPVNYKELLEEKTTVPLSEIFNKYITLSENDSIVNSLLFNNKLTWEDNLSLIRLNEIFSSEEFPSIRSELVKYLGGLLFIEDITRNGRIKDSIYRDSIEYEYKISALNNEQLKTNFANGIVELIYNNSEFLQKNICSTDDQKCIGEFQKVINSNTRKSELKQILKIINISKLRFWIDPVNGNLNQFEISISIPEEFLKDDSKNKIANFNTNKLDIFLFLTFERGSNDIQIDISKYNFKNLIDLLK